MKQLVIIVKAELSIGILSYKFKIGSTTPGNDNDILEQHIIRILLIEKAGYHTEI